MGPPAISQVQQMLLADERLLQLSLQAQDRIVQAKGRSRALGEHSVADAGLVASIIRGTAFSAQQQLPTPSASVGPVRPQPADDPTAASQHSISVLAAVQQRWQKLITERLHAAQMLLPDVPLAATPAEQELANLRDEVADLKHAWERIGSNKSPFAGGFQGSTVGKLLYDAEDLLEAVTAEVVLAQPAVSSSRAGDASQRGSTFGDSSGGQPPVKTSLLQAVRAPSRVWLQSFFADLKADRRQVGIDDVLHPWFREQQVQQAHKASASCSAAACRSAARTGLPASERPWVWATALGLHAAPPDMRKDSSSKPAAEALRQQAAAAAAQSQDSDNSSSLAAESSACAIAAACHAASDNCSDWWRLPSQRDQQVLELLCESVEQQVLLTDVLTCADVQRLADNEHYFIFEESMRAILLAFSRDPSASSTAAVPAAPRLAAEAKAGQQLRPYPPSGVLPFQGLASFLAPLCYAYEHPAAVYRVFVAMYSRYWSCLHTLNLKPAPAAGLPVLCRTFLELLQDVDPDVYRHLSRLARTPLDLAFPWIVSAFVGHLSPTETLLLWDRIIGFDSLLVLPVLAVAVMTFRRELVLAAHSPDELLEVLEDLSQIRLVPLLQALLFES